MAKLYMEIDEIKKKKENLATPSKTDQLFPVIGVRKYKQTHKKYIEY